MAKATKVLLMEWEEEIILQALERGFLRAGAETLRIPITPLSSWNSVREAIEKFQPDFTLTHNYYVFERWSQGPELETWLVDHEIPTFVWFFDHPLVTGHPAHIERVYRGELPKCFYFICIDSTFTERLRAQGYQASTLHLAADPDWLRQDPQKLPRDCAHEIVYVGKPFDLAESLNDDQLLEAFVLGSAEEVLAKLEERLGPQRLKELEAMAPALCHATQDFFSQNISTATAFQKARQAWEAKVRTTCPSESFNEIKIYEGRISILYSNLQLIRYLRSLLPLGLQAYGGSQWTSLLHGLSPQLPRRLSLTEMMGAFAHSKISFCYTKWQFLNAIHERPFLILACSGFPLTDHREILQEVFESDEIAVYRNPEEMLDLARYFLNNETARREIARRGRERVLRSHTYDHRAREILALVRDFCGGG